MSFFLAMMIAGLAGLVLMALPGVFHHGHAGAAPHGVGHVGHGILHAGHTGHGIFHGGHAGHGGVHVGDAGHGGVHAGHAASHAAGVHGPDVGPADEGGADLSWLIPSPIVIFSLMTLFGAFGYALTEAGHLPPMPAGLLAVIPALLIEHFAVTPLWNWLFRFEGSPCAPLDELVTKSATAVTPFHNGRGLVSIVHEGRMVQFRAELADSEGSDAIRVGDSLFVTEVDAPHERVVVNRSGVSGPRPER